MCGVVHEVVAAPDALFAHPVFHDLADEPALRVPEDEARTCDLLNREQVELLAQHAMVAGLDLFQTREVRLQVLVVEEGGSVDALKLLVLLIAEPVGSSDRHDLERLDPARGRHVRTAAEISKAAVAVERNLLPWLGETLDEVDLHELALAIVVGEALFPWFGLANKRLVACDHLCHACFDRCKVCVGKRLLPVHIVKEALVGCRAVPQLGFGEKLQNGRSHDVRGRVAHDFERGLILLLQQPKLDVFSQRLGEIHDAHGLRVPGSVHRLRRLVGILWRKRRIVLTSFGLVDVEPCHRPDTRDDDRCRQPWRDRCGDL